MAIEVELKHIHKNFGTFKASDDVNLTVEKGKLIGLLGPSGSGKTTILRMIAGLEHPDSGDIFIAGKRVNDLPARHWFCVPELRVVPPYDGMGKYRLWAQGTEGAAKGNCRAGG